MLNILIYTLLSALAILNFWWMLKIFSPTHGNNPELINLLCKCVNKLFKTSFIPNIDKFHWCIIFSVTHVSLLYAVIEMLKLLSLSVQTTQIQRVSSLVIAILGICLFSLIRRKIEVTLDELQEIIRYSQTDNIIHWINKYKKVPFLLRMALKQNKDTNFINVYKSMTLHNKLQSKLPEKIEKVKINKI